MKRKNVLPIIEIILIVLMIVGCSPKSTDVTVGPEPIEVIENETNQPEKTNVLKIAISEWEPYLGETIKQNGLLTALAVAALNKVGYQTEILFFSWTRSLEKTKVGEVDALIGASYTEERLEYFSYPEILWPSEIAFFGMVGNNTKYESLEKLAPATIGVYNGSYLIEEFEKVQGISLDPVDTTEQNIQKLAMGRVDYIIDSKDSVNYILTTKLQTEADKIQMLEPVYSKDDLYIVFSKQHPDYEQLTNDFNEGLSAIKADGTYDKIAEDFGLK